MECIKSHRKLSQGVRVLGSHLRAHSGHCGGRTEVSLPTGWLQRPSPFQAHQQPGSQHGRPTCPHPVPLTSSSVTGQRKCSAFKAPTELVGPPRASLFNQVTEMSHDACSFDHFSLKFYTLFFNIYFRPYSKMHSKLALGFSWWSSS